MRKGSGMTASATDLSDRLWKRVALALPSHLDHVVEARGFRDDRTFDVDVAIVTNCSFPGGNASTTLEELRAFREADLEVVLIHCPVRGSPWKRWRVAERYLEETASIVPAHRVREVRCRTLIVRGPRMVMTDNFRRLAPKLHSRKAVFVVNNSAWSENGKPIFDWEALCDRVGSLGWNAEICPTGPIVRAEADRALGGRTDAGPLSDRDWPPAFDPDAFEFAPRAVLSDPVVIGRHGRDHPGKWLEDPDALLAVYPEEGPVHVRVMGGADTARDILGREPSAWDVQPFGATGVEDYLASLDVFVYFPSSRRHEAFGRTIVEALLAGLPVVLPHRFRATFGDLAFYCEPEDVRDVVQRLREDDEGRLAYLHAARALAIDLFGSPSLIRRLDDTAGDAVPRLSEQHRRFKLGIEGGAQR